MHLSKRTSQAVTKSQFPTALRNDAQWQCCSVCQFGEKQMCRIPAGLAGFLRRLSCDKAPCDSRTGRLSKQPHGPSVEALSAGASAHYIVRPRAAK